MRRFENEWLAFVKKDYAEVIHNVRTAYRLLFAQEGTMAERLEDVAGLYKDSRPVSELIEFIRQDSARGICQPKTDQAA